MHDTTTSTQLATCRRSFIAVCGRYRHKPGSCIRLLNYGADEHEITGSNHWCNLASSSMAEYTCLSWSSQSKALVRILRGRDAAVQHWLISGVLAGMWRIARQHYGHRHFAGGG
jgi:hypothetical protein